MSLPPRNKTSDYDRFMNQYLANLNQTIQNQSLVYNAVSANLSGDFADVPQMPQDMRSVEDKLRDIDSLKTQLRPLLMSLTDGATANEIVKTLDDNPKLLQVAIQAFPTLYQSLKPLWNMGVPAVVFIQAVENIQEKIDQTAGIDPAVGAYKSGLLDRIPYVVGLETDEINRQIQIERDMEASEIAAQAREADRLQGEANLEQSLQDLEELKRAAGVVGRARLVKKAKEVVKQRREELAQLEQAQQEQEQEQEPTLGLQPLSRSTSLETKSGEETPRTKASAAAVISAKAEAAIAAETEKRKKEEEAKAFRIKKANDLAETERRLYGESSGSQSPGGGESVMSGKTDTSMITQPSATSQQPKSYLTDFPTFLEGLTDSSGQKKERRTTILTILQKSVDGSTNPALNTYFYDNKPISIENMVSGNLGDNSVDLKEIKKPRYWEMFNVKDMFKTYKEQQVAGTGLKPRRRTMSGRGVSFNIKEDEEAKPSPKKTIKLNIQGVIEKEPSYVPFGRYAINKHRLAGDILMLRTPKNGVVLKLPTQKISNKVSKIILTVANKGVPSFEAIGELDNNDKEILHKILQECHITNISTPNPSRDKSDDMYRRFVILRGEIVAGNDNKELIKELKRLIIILMGKDLLPKREGTQALVELAMLEI